MPSNDRAQKPLGKAPKGQGGKDVKLEKRNRNVNTSLPDRQKEAKEVSEISAAMSEQETVFEPWQLRVIELQSQGWSFEKIIEAGEKARKEKKGNATWGRGAVILPSRKTLWKATTTRPEFKEVCDKAYAFAQKNLNTAVRHVAQIQAYFLFLFQDFRDNISRNDIGDNIRMTYLDAF